MLIHIEIIRIIEIIQYYDIYVIYVVVVIDLNRLRLYACRVIEKLVWNYNNNRFEGYDRQIYATITINHSAYSCIHVFIYSCIHINIAYICTYLSESHSLPIVLEGQAILFQH